MNNRAQSCPMAGLYTLSCTGLQRRRWDIIERALKAADESEQSFMRDPGLPAACSGIIFGLLVHASIV